MRADDVIGLPFIDREVERVHRQRAEPLWNQGWLDFAFSGRDLILLSGGLFLVGKSTHEIHDKLEVAHEERPGRSGAAAFGLILAQILVLDVVFSLDSVITAVGMAKHVPVMVVAMVISVVVMLVFAGRIGDFVNRHPSMKILPLNFLLLVGVMLVAEGMGQHIGKGYIYFAMAFSLGVEVINMRLGKKTAPVVVRSRFERRGTTAAVAKNQATKARSP